MLILDICILIFLGLGFLIGFKRGFTREIVSLVGFTLVLFLSFIFKNPISVLLYKTFPFFKFNFLIKGGLVLNILLYEVIAFLIVFFILFLLLKLLIKITNIFESLLKATIILSIPSKILGGIVGVVKHYILIFIVMFIISLPFFRVNVDESNIGVFILNNSLGLTNIVENKIKVFDEISDLIDKYKDNDEKNEFNQEALDLLIKYKAITKNNAKELIDSGKLKGVKVK